MTTTETPGTPAQPKKSSKKLLIVGLATLVLAGGGTATAWRMTRHAAPAAEKAVEVEHGLISFEPFVVNLADQGGSRFLRVSVRLIVGSAHEAEKIQKSDVELMRVRSAIIELLTEQTADKLVTVEGKAALKQAIAARVEPLIQHAKVTDVLFSDFVVQF